MRWLLLVPMLAVITSVWFTSRWLVGSTVAEYAPSPEEGGLEMANLAVRWAPDDPTTHLQLAAEYETSFSSENLAHAVRECQLAVEAAPYDYRYWMTLGEALGLNGDQNAAEKALWRAVELAPNYSQPRWYYGNLLLRQGKTDAAFEQLTRAAVADETVRQSTFNLAWQVFDGNVDAIIKAVPSPAVRLQFVVYLVDLGNFDPATRLLKSVSEDDRRGQSGLVNQIVTSLLRKFQFHAALTMLREIEPENIQLPNPETIWNGDFEDKITLKDEIPFHWSVISNRMAQISLDTQAHAGNGSLRIVFKAPDKLDTIGASQTVAVEPNTDYRLQFYERTENLLSGGPPVVGVIDPSNNSTLAATQPLTTGTHDWRPATLVFKTGQTDGVQIALMRASCADNQQVCPIFGTVWYDDFILQRVGGARTQRRGAGTGDR